ncbi:hypothetical protein [Sphingomonas sp. Leaf4]|uniref:hypothetical protein n=1 Tax=Sphingomonas sp. Leaf4 TaxID=2876553 RepID=UPI001E46ABC6|nr:hypothetical protein [Sphingomonas sp. Leaf4]
MRKIDKYVISFFIVISSIYTVSAKSGENGNIHNNLKSALAESGNDPRRDYIDKAKYTDSQSQAEELNQPCLPVEINRNSDLCAQWRAADAAFVSSLWSKYSVLISIVGVTIGFLTLISAAAAAFFARNAALENKRSANASEEAIKETKRIGEAQARAYVDFRIKEVECFFNDGESFLLIMYGYINTGQTPAKDMQQWMTWSAVDIDKAEIKPIIKDEFGSTASKIDLGAGQNTFHKDRLPIDASSVEGIVSGNKAYVICGVAKYKDVFGNEFTLRFRRRLSTKSGLNKFIATNADNYTS